LASATARVARTVPPGDAGMEPSLSELIIDFEDDFLSTMDEPGPWVIEGLAMRYGAARGCLS
jgi:hypothetical protein